MLFKPVALVAAATLASAQSSNTSFCDKYTTAVFKTNNATNQYTLLKYVVNTALIGNFTPAPTGSKVKVTGILNAGTYNGTMVNLLPYFDGGLASTNNNGMPSAMSFVDGGGVTPLKNLMPASDTTSNQYTLVTHLYSYFGSLLGCSGYGEMGFPAYAGSSSQYSVHKYMDLNPYQMGYFIQEVALAAESFGVTAADLAPVGMALNGLFNAKCSPATKVIAAQPAELQAMCIDPSCPLAANSSCSGYDAVLAPMVANSTLAMGEGVSSSVTLASSGATSGTAGPAASAATSATGSGSAATTSTASGSSSASPAGAYQTAAPIGAVLAAAGLLFAL